LKNEVKGKEEDKIREREGQMGWEDGKSWSDLSSEIYLKM